jgi:hypothetical protein
MLRGLRHMEMTSNHLFLVVLPLIHLGGNFGLTEQTLTLLPNREFATQFYPDEVDSYITTFRNREMLLKGGHVIGYNCVVEPGDHGRVIVRVVQYVR